MTPAEKVMNDDVQNALNISTLEQLGIPEVPLPFEFEGEQGLFNQLVEVAESVVAEEVTSSMTESPSSEVLSRVEEGDFEDDDEATLEEGEMSGSSENLDELIKRKRHALNKQSGLKAKKRTAQNHKKKKK